jgi:hypothetical protein
MLRRRSQPFSGRSSRLRDTADWTAICIFGWFVGRIAFSRLSFFG